MADKPDQPAEGALIQRALTRQRISARDAASRAGISEGRWRQIVSGYQSARGQYIPVTAPAGTLAHMAKAVGVTPSELAKAGRPDAADVLRDLVAVRVEGDSNQPSLHIDPEDAALVRVMNSALPEAKKRQLVQLLIEERQAADQRRVEYAEQLIRLVGDDA